MSAGQTTYLIKTPFLSRLFNKECIFAKKILSSRQRGDIFYFLISYTF